MDGVSIGHRGHLHIDPAFFPHRLIELGDEVVERGVRLAAVDMPDGNGRGCILLFQRAGASRAEREKQRAE